MRPTPFDLAFGTDAESGFALIKTSLEQSGIDPNDVDAFVMDRAVAAMLRELVPEDGVGEAVLQHVALLQHAYLYWQAGGWLLRLTPDRARELLAAPPAPPTSAVAAPAAYYVQFPERLLWAELAPGEPHEPLDGLFVRPWPGGGYFLLAIFGMHPGRAGFSVVDTDGFPEDDPARTDGSPLFAPVLPGGDAAGLHSIVGEEELLELAARTVPLAIEALAATERTHRPHHPVEVGACP